MKKSNLRADCKYLPVLYHLRTKRAKKLLRCSANCHFLVFKSRLVASKPVRMRLSATARRRYLRIALGTFCEVLYNAGRVGWNAVRQVWLKTVHVVSYWVSNESSAHHTLDPPPSHLCPATRTPLSFVLRVDTVPIMRSDRHDTHCWILTRCCFPFTADKHRHLIRALLVPFLV